MKKKEILIRRKNIFQEFINNKPIDNFKEHLASKYNISMNTLRNDLLLYYDNYATKEEKINYDKRVKYYSIDTPISVIEQGYYYGESVNWNIELIKQHFQSNPKKFNYLLKVILSYATDFLGANENEIKEQIKQQGNYNTSNEFKRLYNKIKQCITKEEIIELCINFNESLGRLKELINSYCVNEARINNLNKNDFLNEVNHYLQPYFDYLKEQNKIKNEQIRKQKYESIIADANKIVLAFITQNKDKKEFCKINNIECRNWNKYINIIKDNNPALYNNYCHRIRKEEKKHNQISMEKTLQLLYFLNNGIKFNGTRRPIDIIDYDRIINYPVHIIQKSAKTLYYEKKITKDDLIKIDEFFKKNCIHTGIQYHKSLLFNEIDIDNILKEQNKFITEENGKQVVRVITEEEKLNIINEIKKYNVLVTKKRYYTCIQRLIKGIDNYDTKILTKKNTRLFY